MRLREALLSGAACFSVDAMVEGVHTSRTIRQTIFLLERRAPPIKDGYAWTGKRIGEPGGSVASIF